MDLSKDRVIIAKRLKGAAGFKCENCGKEIDRNFPASLVLHHIDRNEKNNEIENLIVLCRQCHRDRHCRRGWVI